MLHYPGFCLNESLSKDSFFDSSHSRHCPKYWGFGDERHMYNEPRQCVVINGGTMVPILPWHARGSCFICQLSWGKSARWYNLTSPSWWRPSTVEAVNYTKQRWVFGIYYPEQKVGHVQLVEQRDAATLLPIIQTYVAPRTTIWSNELAAYRQAGSLGYYTHQTVNHSEHFMDLRPITVHQSRRGILARCEVPVQHDVQHHQRYAASIPQRTHVARTIRGDGEACLAPLTALYRGTIPAKLRGSVV